MTRSELALLFQNPDAVLQIAGFQETKEGSFVARNGSEAEASAKLAEFLSKIDLERNGLLTTRAMLLKFLDVPNDPTNPNFRLPHEIKLPGTSEVLAVDERLVVSLQPRSQVDGRVNPGGWGSITTQSWDEVWHRQMYSTDETQRSFNWDCGRCRPGHHLVALFRGKDRVAILNWNTRTYWIDKLRVGVVPVAISIVVGIVLSSLAFGLVAPINSNNPSLGFLLFISVLAGVAWYISHRKKLDRHRIGIVCAHLLGGTAPKRKSAWFAAATTVTAGLSAVAIAVPALQQESAVMASIPDPIAQQGYRDVRDICNPAGHINGEAWALRCVDDRIRFLSSPKNANAWKGEWSEVNKRQYLAGARLYGKSIRDSGPK